MRTLFECKIEREKKEARSLVKMGVARRNTQQFFIFYLTLNEGIFTINFVHLYNNYVEEKASRY